LIAHEDVIVLQSGTGHRGRAPAITQAGLRCSSSWP
jgi:hypothetical protein